MKHLSAHNLGRSAGLFILTLSLSLLNMSSAPAHAADEGFWQKSEVTIDVTYASQYLGRRGASFFGDGAAIHPSINVDLGGTGLYAGVWAAYSVDNGCRDPFGDLCADWDEYDYYVGFANSVWKDAPLATSYDLSYTQLTYPKQTKQDDQEIGFNFSHPSLLPVIGVSRPTLYWGLYYDWQVDNDGEDRREVKLGVSYQIPVETQMVNTYLDAIWADRPGGSIEGHGLTRIRTGASTTFDINGFSLKPSINYQSALKETGPSDWIESEFWFKVSISRTL